MTFNEIVKHVSTLIPISLYALKYKRECWEHEYIIFSPVYEGITILIASDDKTQAKLTKYSPLVDDIISNDWIMIDNIKSKGV